MINEYFLTLDSKNGDVPTVLAVSYETREIAEDWARQFSNDPCHSYPGWVYGVVRIPGGEVR